MEADDYREPLVEQSHTPGGGVTPAPRRPRRRLIRTRVALAILGVVLLVGSGVLRFAVLPAVSKLPTDSNTTNVYAGTARVLLNQAALAPGSKAPIMLYDIPLRIDETVRVLKANGSLAVVDYRTTETAGGAALPVMDDRYVVNRSTLAASTGLSWPGLTVARGLTISFPIGTLAHDYTGWVQDTGLTTPLRYAGTASGVSLLGKAYAFGFRADVFKQNTPPALITDRQELAALPAGIPKSEIPALVMKLHLPSSEIGKFAGSFAKFPSTVPLVYTYAATYTYWVAPRDGVVVDLQAVETRTVELPASLLGVAVPIATVSQFVYTDTPATLVARIHEAQSDASSLALVGTTLPLVALIVGIVLLLAAALLGLRRPSAGPAARGHLLYHRPGPGAETPPGDRREVA